MKKGCRPIRFHHHVFYVLLFIALAIAAAGCRPAQASWDNRILISIDSSKVAMKSVLPGISMDIAEYSISGSGPNGGTFGPASVSAGAYEAQRLAPGSWTVVVEGLNASKVKIALGTATVMVPASGDVAAQVAMKPLDGNGTLSLSVSWAGRSLSSPSVSAILTSATTSESTSLGFTISGTTAVYAGSFPSGYYELILKLLDGSSQVWGKPDGVRIAKDATSSMNYSIDGSSSGGPSDAVLDASSSPVLNLTGTASQSVKVSVVNAIGKTLYLVKSNQDASAVDAASTGGSTQSAAPSNDALDLSIAAGPILLADKADAQDFNAHPPAIGAASRKSLLRRTSTYAYGEAPSGYVEGSTTRSFWVEDASSNWIQIQATLRAIGRYCYMWVADANFSSQSSAANDELLTQEQVYAFRDVFDGSADQDYANSLYNLVTNVFGYEYGGGTGGTGGMDGDQHVSLLFFDIDYDFTPTQSGGVLGYFWGKDEYTDSEMQGYGLRSNEAEMLYIDAFFADGYPGMIKSTCAHELQHAINFNQKSLRKGLSSPTWYNEMCSMVSEDLVRTHLGLSTGDSPQGRLRLYNQYYFDSGITDWLSGNNVLKSYASAYAFGAFLARTYGGAPLFAEISSNGSVGIDSVVAAIQSLGGTDGFGRILDKYATALVFPTKAHADVYPFGQSTTVWNGYSYELNAINLYDYNGGPSTFSPSSKVSLRPYGNSIHTQAGWSSISGSMDLTLTLPSNGSVHFALMAK
jgi:hypothetical protein